MPYYRVDFTVEETVSISGRADKKTLYRTEVEAESERDAKEIVQNNWTDYTENTMEHTYDDESWEEDGSENDFNDMDIDEVIEIESPTTRPNITKRNKCTKNRI